MVSLLIIMCVAPNTVFSKECLPSHASPQSIHEYLLGGAGLEGAMLSAMDGSCPGKRSRMSHLLVALDRGNNTLKVKQQSMYLHCFRLSLSGECLSF